MNNDNIPSINMIISSNFQQLVFHMKLKAHFRGFVLHYTHVFINGNDDLTQKPINTIICSLVLFLFTFHSVVALHDH